MTNAFKGIVDYEYTPVEVNGNQYEVDDLTKKGVEAKYVKCDSDKGNIYIEALPKPRMGETLRINCVKPLYEYTSREEEIKKPLIEQIMMITKLREVRFQLPVNKELETECYLALIKSYRKRSPFYDKDVLLNYEAHNTTLKTNMVISSEAAEAANEGFSLVGYSGCGKSSALKTLFSNYPQYISHKGVGVVRYPQIVYLVVQCPPHSNFRGLYKNIGVAIDKALGNLIPVYADHLDAGKAGNLSLYKDRVRTLIEQFGIGIIVFDEIQHLNFSPGVENSFETLLELINETNVAFAVVGTEEAKEKLFNSTLRQVRRTGTEIHADRYCVEIEMFRYFVKELFKYQWFDKDESLDEENMKAMTLALYECTGGIIDQLIGLYMYMNIDYVRSPKGRKPTVNAEYIYKVSEKHYKGMRELLKDMKRTERRRIEISDTAKTELEKIMSEESARTAREELLTQMKDSNNDKVDLMRTKVVQNVLNFTDAYTVDAIGDAVGTVLSSDDGKKLLIENDERAITRMTAAVLQKRNENRANAKEKKTDKKRREAVSEIQMNYVLSGADKPDDLLS